MLNSGLPRSIDKWCSLIFKKLSRFSTGSAARNSRTNTSRCSVASMTTATAWEPSRSSRPSTKGCHLLKTARNAENAIFMQQLFFWFWLGTLGWFKKNRDAAPLSDWDEKAYVAAASAQEFSFVGGKGLETWRDAFVIFSEIHGGFS